MKESFWIVVTPSLAWLALACAFTPALIALAHFFWAGEAPVDRAPLIGAALLSWSALTTSPLRQPPRRDGGALLLFACGLELVGVGSASWSITYAALPLGVVGLARLLGSPPVRSAALAFFAVPLPYFLTALFSPGLEAAYARLGAAVSSALSLPIRATVASLDGPAGGIDLIPADGGVALAQLLAGVGWFGGVRARASGARCTAAAAALGLAAVPLQAVGVIAAAVAVGAGAPQVALFVLRHALWLLAALTALMFVVRRWNPRVAADPPAL